MSEQPIVWHAHPTVAEQAVLGGYEALLWGGDNGTGYWAVYELSGADEPVRQRVARDQPYTEAKAEAEATLRDLVALATPDPRPAFRPHASLRTGGRHAIITAVLATVLTAIVLVAGIEIIIHSGSSQP